MNLAIIGTGYVGLTTGVCLADCGHRVVCADIDSGKIAELSNGTSPIYERGLEAMIKKNIAERRLSFTCDNTQAVRDAQIVFFALPTPEGAYGKADLSILFNAVDECARATQSGSVFVIRSTAPPGTVAKMKEMVLAIRESDDISVAANPEFLSEGNAVEHFLHPDRIVVGVDDERARVLLTELYRPISNGEHPLIITTAVSAEIIKYAANAFLALKISFINEIADFCELIGGDIKEIARGIGTDKRIGTQFLRAGIGYGGSCFGKDTKALVARGEECGHEFKVIKALSTVNDLRYTIVLKKLKKYFSDLKGVRVAALGLAFKPMTNDVRDTPAERILFELLEAGISVIAFDPIAMPQFRKHCKRSNEITYAETLTDALRDADAVVVITEWNEFKNLDLKKTKSLMRGNIIIDGRNIFEPADARDAGFTYEGVGR